MSISGFCLRWVLVFILKFLFQFNDASEGPKDFTYYSKDRFCSGKFSVRVNPRFIPELLEYLRHCSVKVKQSNGNSVQHRQALTDLFDSATPVLHKAFFDSKTGLKQIVQFTKMKDEAFRNMKKTSGNTDSLNKKQWSEHKVKMTYDPANDDGSYNLDEDLRLCSSILNIQANTNVKHIIKLNQLPKVARAAGTISFPPFNLSVGISSDDTPYMILDMYVIAMRCLSFTNLQPDTTTQVSESLINWLKKKIMPYIPPHEFEKAYSGMMSLIERQSIPQPSLPTRIVKLNGKFMHKGKGTDETTKEGPIVFKIKYDYQLPGITENVVEISTKAKLNKCGKHLEKSMDRANQRNKDKEAASRFSDEGYDEDEQDLVDSAECGGACISCPGRNFLINNCGPDDVSTCCQCQCPPKLTKEAIIIICCILGICVLLAVLLCCFICGCVTVGTDSEVCMSTKNDDDVNCFLADFTRQSINLDSDSNKCYCALTDTNQMDVIAALHERCEALSQKIHLVVQEISKEKIFEDPESAVVLREFVRSVSHDMVDDDMTLHQLGTAGRAPSPQSSEKQLIT